MGDKGGKIRAGALVLVSSGEYSDYYVRCVCRAIRDIDVSVEEEKYLTEHPEQREDYEFEQDEFIAWLVSTGVLEELDKVEWHLGSYGQPESAVR